jgi:diguanylate cyclase (GGDEF)-like protein
MGLGTKIRRLLALLALALFAGVPAQALDKPVQACAARLLLGESAPQVSAIPARFDCRSRQNLLGAGDFAVQLKFDPITASADDPLVLHTGSVWQDGETVRFGYADGSEAKLDVTSKTTSQYLMLGAILEFPVPYRQSALTSILIETRGSANLRGLVIGPRLMTRSEAGDSRLSFVATYSAFAGLALALLIYNLSLWRALRQRFQLHYSMMVAALIAYAFTASGALMLAMPSIANNDRLRVNYIVLAFCALTGVRFVRTFFEREVREEWLRSAILITGIAAMLSALAFAAMAPWHIGILDKIYFIMMSALVVSIFPLLALAGYRRARHFPLFMLAWSAPIVITVLRAAYGFNLVPYSVWLDNGNLFAMAIEAMLSALLVTARVREISLQRDHAIAGEQSARELAAIDPLTGLLNRRSFLDQAIGLRARQTLLLIDIDHFKAVNDRLGHEAGDRVLAAVAAAIEGCRPPRGLAVRLGGEEFGMLIPRAMADKQCAERVLDVVRNVAMPRGVTVTVSIGISEGQVSSEDDWKRLYRLADAALYRAKSDGRDRACKATDFRDAA